MIQTQGTRKCGHTPPQMQRHGGRQTSTPKRVMETQALSGLIGDPVVIGDTIFFDAIAHDSSSAYKKELWAHDTSNHSTWQVSNLSGASSSNHIGSYVFLRLGDTLYFSNTHSSNFWLWAYDTTNQSVWNTSIRPGDSLSVVVGNTIYLEGSVPLSNTFGLIAHQPESVNHQTNTGGNVITWAINAVCRAV